MASWTWLKHLRLAALTTLCASCDTFFTFNAQVTACDSGLPLQGVAATTHLDDGFGEEDHHATTDANGRLSIVLNEPEGVVVTVTLSKAGYEPWSKQYKGAPKSEAQICLTPSP